MRLLFEYETEALHALVERKTDDKEDDLLNSEDINAHDHLRKNLGFYLNNYLMLMPNKDPRSFYINLRVNGNHTVASLAEGKPQYTRHVNRKNAYNFI